jgi:hypothetical protein
MSSESKRLRTVARQFTKEHKCVKCPAFPKEPVFFTSKGLSHLFYSGSQKRYPRPTKESKVRVELLPLAVKVLERMPLPQEESEFDMGGRQARYWAFEAVVDDRRIKVIVRQIGNGAKHFWSVIPAWRKQRGARINARGNLSNQ